MKVIIDSKRGKEVAKLLYKSFSTVGIHGRKDMPEDLLLKGVAKGSLEHIMFITLTVSIDYQRDALSLWDSSRRTFEDPETRYLFYPKSLHRTPLRNIVKDMHKYKLSKKTQKDARIWRTVGVTFYKKWGGDPRNFLQDCNWDAPTILTRLKEEATDFPYLRGDKIAPLWLRMLRDNVGISGLRHLDKAPIPVDIHVARASLVMGVLRGKFRGNLEDLFGSLRKSWSESVKGLNAKDRPMIALDMDEPLWHLSKYGCGPNRDKITGTCSAFNKCEAKEYCVKGKIKIENGNVEIDT